MKLVPATRQWYVSPLVLLVLASGVLANEPREVRGRVVDQAGMPVAGAAVGYFWRANGTGRDRDGKPLDLKKPENVRLLWSNLGVMEPVGRPDPIRAGSDGRFLIKDPDPFFAVMAMDPERRSAGIALIPTTAGAEPLEIRLVPHVTVRGSFEGPGPGQRPSWTHVYIHVPEDPARPIHSTRLVSCGSFEAKFEVRLPPGKYTLQGYSQSEQDDRLEGELVPNKPFVLEPGQTELDLGRLKLVPHRPYRETLEAKAKALGSWNDYTQHYGESPPQWHAVDARGVSKDALIPTFEANGFSLTSGG